MSRLAAIGSQGENLNGVVRALGHSMLHAIDDPITSQKREQAATMRKAKELGMKVRVCLDYGTYEIGLANQAEPHLQDLPFRPTN